MTPQEIINEIQKLPVTDWESIKKKIDSVRTDFTNNGNDEAPISETKPVLTEIEFLEKLYAEGIISNIPDPDSYSDDDDDFEPIEILGRPTSELIIEDRR